MHSVLDWTVTLVARLLAPFDCWLEWLPRGMGASAGVPRALSMRPHALPGRTREFHCG